MLTLGQWIPTLHNLTCESVGRSCQLTILLTRYSWRSFAGDELFSFAWQYNTFCCSLLLYRATPYAKCLFFPYVSHDFLFFLLKFACFFYIRSVCVFFFSKRKGLISKKEGVAGECGLAFYCVTQYPFFSSFPGWRHMPCTLFGIVVYNRTIRNKRGLSRLGSDLYECYVIFFERLSAGHSSKGADGGGRWHGCPNKDTLQSREATSSQIPSVRVLGEH